MSYSLVIPPRLVTRLFFIRCKTGVSIRRQILQAIEKHLENYPNWEKAEDCWEQSALQN